MGRERQERGWLRIGRLLHPSQSPPPGKKRARAEADHGHGGGGGRGWETQGERIRERELEQKMDRGRSLAPEEKEVAWSKAKPHSCFSH